MSPTLKAIFSGPGKGKISLNTQSFASPSETTLSLEKGIKPSLAVKASAFSVDAPKPIGSIGIEPPLAAITTKFNASPIITKTMPGFLIFNQTTGNRTM